MIVPLCWNHFCLLQYIVLSNCASLVAKQPTIFVPYLKEFFVRLGTLAHATAFAFARADASTRFSARSAAAGSDPHFNSMLKLEILTHLINGPSAVAVLFCDGVALMLQPAVSSS